MGNPLARRLAIFVVIAGVGLSSQAGAETLDYKVTYDGMFTAFKEVGIGDARLDVDQTTARLDGEPIMRARLSATSAAYPVVEQFYPFRYEFTSYHQREKPRTLAYERRKQTTRLRHDLLLVDWGVGAVKRFQIEPESRAGNDAAARTEALLSTLQRAGLPDYRGQLAAHPDELAEAPGATLDRLALLQQIRNLPLADGTRHELTVTDGKTYIRYAATVVGREVLATPVGERDAWKVRIDGFDDTREAGYGTAREALETDGATGDEAALRHPPVYVWIGTGPRRLPLRLVSRHAVGTFSVALHREQTIQSAALPALGGPAAR